MAFEDTERSRYDSAPVELYRFSGTFRSFYLTSSSKAVSFLGMEYLPVAGLSRGKIEVATQSEDHGELEVELPTTHQLVRDYAFQQTPPELSLILYRLQRDTGESAAIFRGKITGFKPGKDSTTLTIPSSFDDVLNSALPTVYIQPSCNHVLFDNRCKVSRAAFSNETEVVSANGRQITVEAVSGRPSGFFVGGELFIPQTGERRSITEMVGNVVTVGFEFTRITQGMNVTLTAGCNLSYTSSGGCPKFNNKKNFGGFPYAPGETNNVFANGVK